MNTINRESQELNIANAAIRYHREQQGRAPGRISVTISRNLVAIVTNDIYTPNEEHLAISEEGRTLVKSARRELRSLTRDRAHAEISRVCGCPVLRSYWDLDTRVGEQFEAYILADNIEKNLRNDASS